VILKITRGSICLAALMLFSVLLAPAQTTMGHTGSVNGTVTSSAGTPLANATIELENISTGARMRTMSDAQGNYRFENVSSGTYRMHTSTVQGSGTPSSDIVVDATRPKTVNITMQASTVGAQTAALITVDDATTIQGLESPIIRTAWNTRYIEYQPEANLMERNGEIYGAYNLTLLNFGVANNTGFALGRGPLVGGQQPIQNNFMIEGIDNNNRALPGPLVYLPNEATKEMVVYQNQFSPEYGHSSAGQFNSQVRTGTNRPHGTFYWYNQNRHLNAVDRAFARQGFNENPRYDQNRLGASFGTPIVPNSLFFFGNFEYIPLGVAAQPIQPVFGPTGAGLNQLGNLQGVSQANLNILRQNLPVAQTGTQFQTIGGQQIPFGQMQFGGNNWQNSYIGSGGLDWTIGTHDSLRARYVHNEITAGSSQPAIPSVLTGLRNRSLLANVSHYRTLGASGVNELRLGYTRFRQFVDNPGQLYPGMSGFANLGIARDLGFQMSQGFMGIGPAGLNNWQIADNVNVTAGRHTIRFGGDFRRYLGPLNYATSAFGNFGPASIERFLMNPNQNGFGYGSNIYSGNNWSLYSYLTDTWRVLPNLSLNFGVRHQYVTIPQTLRLQGRNQVANVPGVLEFNEPATQWRNFAPRVGLAFSPTSMRNTVFRAGFGMNYDAQMWQYASLLPTVPPGVVTTEVAQTVTPIFGFFGSGAFVENWPYNVFTPSVTPEQARAGTSSFIQDQRLPRTMQWNANIEQTIFNRFVLNIGYLGVRADRLPVQDVMNRTAMATADRNLPLFYQQPTQAQLNALPVTLGQLQTGQNNPWAQYGFNNSIYTMRQDARSWYDGLLVQATQRFSGGLQVRANYTWSHLRDELGGPNFATGNGGGLPWAHWRTERNTSIYDRRHVGNLTAMWDLGAIGPRTFNFVRDILANMTVAGTYMYQSAPAIPITSGFDAAGGGVASSGVFVNPNATMMGTGSGVSPLRNNQGQVVGYLANNPNAQFVSAGAGQFANAGRQLWPGIRPINNFNAAVHKRFGVRDRFSLELHAQAFNVLNRSQYQPGSINSIGFGQSVQDWSFLTPGNAGFGDPTSIFSSQPRTMQLGVRVQF
jgi:hypothetical protein